MDTTINVRKSDEAKTKTDSFKENVDFETAISLTGFGRFNILLLLVTIPSAWTTIFETTTMSYILPSAECDLNLSNFNKGVLNAVTYGGMISSAFMWGFLSDTLGRWKLLVTGCYLLSTIVIASSFSQAFWVLAVFKFLGGFVACGPFAAMLTYLAEISGSQHRAKIIMINGIYTGLGIITVPAIAWLIIPQPWSFSFFGGYITINSWRIFLMVSALPSFLTGTGMLFFNESPKFLMSSGKSEAALKVLRRVYSINTGNPPEMYPVKSLKTEMTIETSAVGPDASQRGHKNIGPLTILKLGYKQMKPFFHKPHVSKAMLVFLIQFGGLWGMNTIRLWLPQLFAIVEEFFTLHEESVGNATLCDMLAMRTGSVEVQEVVFNNTSILPDKQCVPVQIGDSMYLNSVIVGAVTAMFNLSASSVINCLGKKKILVIGYMIGCACVVAMYWSWSMEILMVLAALFVGSSSMCTNALMSVVVDLFPTSLRTTSVSLTMMIGRLGALTGNLTFPILLEFGCSVPFFLIGGITLLCSCLTFLLPRTTGKSLE